MPLIKCVDCGKEISDSVPNCPNCGSPVVHNISETTRKKIMKKSTFIALCVLAVAILSISIYMWYEMLTESSSTGKKKEGITLSDGKYVMFDKNGDSLSLEKIQEISADNKPDHIINLLGGWTGSFDSLYFGFENESLEMIKREYVYEEKHWTSGYGSITEITDTTFTIGTGTGPEVYTYKRIGDVLCVNGRCYTVSKKNTDYAASSDATPIRGDLFFGMTREDILRCADSEFDHDDVNGEDFYLTLPMIVPEQSGGYVFCDLNEQGLLEKMSLCFATESSGGNRETLKNALIRVYSQDFWQSVIDVQEDETTVTYIWTVGDMKVQLVDRQNEFLTITYEMVS